MCGVAHTAVSVFARIFVLPPSDARPASVALSAYFVGAFVAPALGAYPVPLVGMGMSPILGFWLGTGALASAMRSGSWPDYGRESPGSGKFGK